MKRCAIIILLSLNPAFIYSQSLQIDSLKVLLPEVEGNAIVRVSRLDSLMSLLKDATGNKKARLLNEISLLVPFDEALSYMDKVIAVATDSVILARAISNKGIKLYHNGFVQEAEELLMKAIPVFEKNKAAEYYVECMYSVFGKIQMFKGHYSSAFEFFYKNLAMVSKRDDSHALGYQLLDLGVLYYKVRNNAKAMELYSRASSLLKIDRSIQFLGYMNTSLCLSELGFPSLALAYCDSAFSLANGREKDLLHAEFAVGFAKLKLSCYEEARIMFKNSLARSIQLGDTRMEADNLLYIGKTWLAEGMLDSAESVLIRAEELGAQNQFKEILLDTYRGVMQIADRRNDFLQLTTYQQKYIQLKDDVYSIELEKNLASLEGEWYEYVNGKVIDSQELEIDERYNALMYQQWISVTLCLIVLLVVFIIGLYLRGIYLQRRSQVLLEAQVYSRVKRLKPLGLLHSRHVDVGHTDQTQELNDELRQCRRNLFKLIKKTPEMLADDSVAKYFSRMEMDYTDFSKIFHDQSTSIRTKG